MQFTNRDENLINFELETVLKAVFEAVQNWKLRSIGLSIMVLTAFFEELTKNYAENRSRSFFVQVKRKLSTKTSEKRKFSAKKSDSSL